MKKVLSALILFAAVIGLFALKTNAAETGNLVIHFKAWDGDYSTIGSHAWVGGASGKLKDGVDDFGAYWNYDNIPVETEFKFIAVNWKDGGPDWTAKKTGDIAISPDAIVAGETTHVYVFQGAASKIVDDKGVDGERQNFYTVPGKKSMLVVYYDPTNAYEETIGVHYWDGMYVNSEDEGSPAWGTPVPLEDAGLSAAGFAVKAIMIKDSDDTDDKGGALVYAGEEKNKKTNDLNILPATALGSADVIYVAGSGNNVFRSYSEFADLAFTFKLLPFNKEKMTGTHATSPQTIVVKASQDIPNPSFGKTTILEQNMADAQVKSWFTVREDLGEGKLGTPLIIDRVDYAKSNEKLTDFVINLRDGSVLDLEKNYIVEFDLGIVETVNEVEVTLNLIAPANTPAEAELFVAGEFTGWKENHEDFKATKIGNFYTITFKVNASKAINTFEYKWTRGTWASNEYIDFNRKLVVYGHQKSVTLVDEVAVWEDLKLETDVKAIAPNREPVAQVTLTVIAPMDTPAEAELSVAGGFNGWTPGDAAYKATKVGNIYVLTFNVTKSAEATVFEYKWTKGSWDTEEFIASNRKLFVYAYEDKVSFVDVIEAFKDDFETPVDDDRYAAPVREPQVATVSDQKNLAAFVEIDVDNEAPVFTFIGSLANKPAAERIIEIEWGKAFDQNLFPSYRVVDNRDGDLTTSVFVPKGEFAVINTAVEGDYTIMLQVEDKWGNIAQETFIFRVVKK